MQDMREEGPELIEHVQIFEKAKKRKWKRFTFQGLAFLILAVVCIAVGLQAPEVKGVFVAIGILCLIASIFSFLIGIINPFVSDALRWRHEKRVEVIEIEPPHRTEELFE